LVPPAFVLPAVVTVRVKTADVDGAYVVGVGVNTAVSEKLPDDANVVDVAAVPVAPVHVTATGVLLMTVLPLKNVTVPAGEVPSAAVTVAVRVTLVAVVTPVFGDTASVVVVAVWVGPLELVVYVVAPEATETNVDPWCETLPVAPAAL
jgi:hypothetical protein